jgi:hypothetical protein
MSEVVKLVGSWEDWCDGVFLVRSFVCGRASEQVAVISTRGRAWSDEMRIRLG